MRSPHLAAGPCVLVFLSAVPAQNTTWRNFENRTSLALAPEPGGSVLAFGGDRVAPNTPLDDTWRLSPGAGWSLVTPGGSVPDARSGHGLGYFAGNPSTVPPRAPGTVLFGGSTATGVSAQTWVYNGNNWSLKTPATTPPPRTGHGVAGDIARRVVLMFGGSGLGGLGLNDTWEWNGIDWVARGMGASAPADRSGHAMAWNQQTGRVVMFGGNPALDETWEFDPQTDSWVRRLTQPGNTPPGRTATALAYDGFNRQVILFGGRDGAGGVLRDTWIWDPSVPPAGGWVQRTPALSPPGRKGHAMAFDAVAQRVILVGGTDAANATLENTFAWDGNTWSQRTQRPPARDAVPMVWDSDRGVAVLFAGDTWELSDSGWAERFPVSPPSARTVHCLAYDAPRRRVVLFGGQRLGQSVYLDDTWEFDGAGWIPRPTANRPPALSSANMVYDVARGNVVLFGGEDANRAKRAETWIYDGVDWSLRSPANVPVARSGHGMAYDRRRGRVVMFGGADYAFSGFRDDTWEWDGTNWVPLNPSPRPSARGCYLAYDEARGRVMLFGGFDGTQVLADVWEWDGSMWTIVFPRASPSARAFSSLAYDEINEVTYLWGGYGPGTGRSDTWYHQSLFPARYRTRDAQGQLLGPGCPGSAGTPTLRVGVGERPWLGDTFTIFVANVPANPLASLGFGASQVPGIPLGFLGMGSCVAHSIPAVFVPMSSTGSLTLTVPIDPSLVLSHFYNQAFVFDPPANPRGLTASDLAEATIGVR